MMSEILVFVYGTLKPGRRYWAQFCEGKVTRSVEAKIRGELYQLNPGYPGLLTGDEWVFGYVLWLKNSEALAGFDELEDYKEDRPPEQNEYNRERVDCYDAQGKPLCQAWTYYLSPVRAQGLGAVKIDSGVWEESHPTSFDHRGQ